MKIHLFTVKGDRGAKKDKQNPKSSGSRDSAKVNASAWLLILAMTVMGIAFILGVYTVFKLMTQFSAPPVAVNPPESPPAVSHTQRAASFSKDERSSLSHQSASSSGRPQQPVPVPDETAAGSNNNTSPKEELTGINVFPPLGTKPLQSGIIVPDDFELPPGYIRHYQMTDDGRQLAPILMYNPDHPPLDYRGEPIQVPPDRVVPPDMAPRGLAINILEVPKTELHSDDPQEYTDETTEPEPSSGDPQDSPEEPTE